MICRLLAVAVWLAMSLLTMPSSRAEPIANADAVTIHYIGSSGYLVEVADRKILIDGAFDNYVARFEVTIPSGPVRQALATGQAPFNDIDLILVSHSHKGHFEPVLLGQVVANNPAATLVCNQAVKQAMAPYLQTTQLADLQLYAPDLAVGESVGQTLNDVAIYITNTNHWGGLTQFNYQLSYAGATLLYALEPDDYQAQQTADIQFVSGLDVPSQAKHRLLTHQSGHDKKRQLAQQIAAMDRVSFLNISGDKLKIELD